MRPLQGRTGFVMRDPVARWALTTGFYEAGSCQASSRVIGSRFYPSCRDCFLFRGPI